MILGAGVYQVPLIRKAKEMGLEAVVVSYKGRYPGISLADTFIDIDTRDADRVLIAARETGISAIVTTGTDVCLPSMGRVVEELGLPGTGYSSACRSMDKLLMKQAFIAHRVPTAAFGMFRDAQKAEEFAGKLGYPVMVKATDSSGSRGITKVNSANEFSFAWERAQAVSHPRQVIVEQFLSGTEFGAQAFIHGNEVVAIFPHGDTVTPSPFFSPIGHSMPARLTEEQLRKSTAVVEHAARALGLRDCVSNVDLMLVDDQPMIIEIGARMGATCLPECISIYSGMNAYEHVIRLAMGEHPEIKVTQRQANACLLLCSDTAGTVVSLGVPDEVLQHPGLIDLQWDVSVGDEVRAFNVGPDRIGHIIVKSATAEEAERLVETLSSKISIEVRT